MADYSLDKVVEGEKQIISKVQLEPDSHRATLKKGPFDKIKLEEKITLAMHKGDYSSALEYLCEVSDLQSDPKRRIYSLLQKIACEAKTEIHYSPSGSLHELVRLTMDQQVSPETAMAEAEESFAEKSFSKGFALYYSACKLYLASSDVDEALGGVKMCFKKINEHLAPLVIADEFKKKLIAGHVLPALCEVLNDMKKIKGANPIDLAKARGWCSVRIASFYQQLGEDGKVIRELKKAISDLESGPRCEIWGICLNNVGTASSRLGQVEDAKHYYKEAISVYHTSDDLTNEEKVVHLEETSQNQNLLTKY